MDVGGIEGNVVLDEAIFTIKERIQFEGGKR
jgi:hypothetical protein